MPTPSSPVPPEARADAVRELTAAAAAGALTIPVARPLPLERIAEAHDLVDAGSRERILVDLG